MLSNINHLTEDEKNLVLHSPMYVSALIAGADGDITLDEKHKVAELIHIKTFSEKYELRDLYQDLDVNAEAEFRKLIAALPENIEERNQYLSDFIAELNDVFPKLDKHFAIQLYKSLREFAHYIANADGGFWSVGAVSEQEHKYVKLPMLHNPEKH